MIYVKLISGLGNQLFQYAIGRQLSLKHNVPLKLDTTFFETQTLRSYRLDKYNIKAGIAAQAELQDVIGIYSDHGIVSRIKRKVERNLPKSMSRLFKEASPWVYEPEVLKTSSTVYLDGYWQHQKYFTSFPSSIFDELTVSETGDRHFQALLQQIKNDGSSVSLHIRRSDYLSDVAANRLMGVLPLSYYHQAIKTIREKVGNPVFIFFPITSIGSNKILTWRTPFFILTLQMARKNILNLN